MTGKEFAEWREKMGWSQEQAAAALAKTRRQIQTMENQYDVGATIGVWCLCLLGVRQDLVCEEFEKYLRPVVEAVDAMPQPGRPEKKQ